MVQILIKRLGAFKIFANTPTTPGVRDFRHVSDREAKFHKFDKEKGADGSGGT